MFTSFLAIVRCIWKRVVSEEEVAVRITVDPSALWADLKKPRRVHVSESARKQPTHSG